MRAGDLVCIKDDTLYEIIRVTAVGVSIVPYEGGAEEFHGWAGITKWWKLSKDDLT